MTSETYVRAGQDRTKAGTVILMVTSFLAAALVIGGLIYAAGASARNKAALAAAGCEPNLSHSGLPCTTVWVLEKQYTAITSRAIQQLSNDVTGYTANEWNNLAAAKAALRAEATSANAFETSLARFPFPPAVAPQANALTQAIAARVKLIAKQARSSSLAQLRSFNHRLQIAGAAVEADMRLVRRALYTRPAASQEP